VFSVTSARDDFHSANHVASKIQNAAILPRRGFRYSNESRILIAGALIANILLAFGIIFRNGIGKSTIPRNELIDECVEPAIYRGVPFLELNSGTRACRERFCSRGIRFAIERFGIQPFQPEAPSKDYGKPAGTHRRITDNKRGITNIAMFMVSERQYMLVYHDPSLNIQMRRATPIDRYPSTATSDQPRTRCTFARKQHSKTSPASLARLSTPVSLPWTKGRPREITRRTRARYNARARVRLLDGRAALITRATMFRSRPRFFSAFSRHANLRSAATATTSSNVAVCFKGAPSTPSICPAAVIGGPRASPWILQRGLAQPRHPPQITPDRQFKEATRNSKPAIRISSAARSGVIQRMRILAASASYISPF